MGFFGIFRHLYLFFSRRRSALFISVSIIILASFFYLGNIRLSEDIKSLLPDNHRDFLLEFNLLQQTPFMHKLIINLRNTAPEKKQDLTKIADSLAENMLSSSYITNVTTGPVSGQDMDIYDFVIKSLPNLTDNDDLENIETALKEENVREKLMEGYSNLFLPEGSLFTGYFRLDPLDFKSLIFRKLASLNIIPEATLKDNHFVDRSGNNILIIADTSVDVTDISNAEKMLAELDSLKKRIVPDNVDLYMVSPQSYSVANARAIKKDLFVVLSISSLCLIILFFLFLKNWRASFILLISFSSFAIALVGVSFIYKAVSAITIGFGSVLLGLSDDLSLHVYFALRREDRGRDSSHIISEVSRPVLFGGLIIICSLSLLLFSDLPGQRQLGAFSIIGVLVSLVFTLILLPQMMQASLSGKGKSENILLIQGKVSRPLLIICVWIILLAGCIWTGRQISFNGDLNKLNYTSDELVEFETHIRDIWGDVRSKLMIFSEGDDIESALEVNDRLFQYLSENSGDNGIVSIAPLLPSIKTQKSNRAAWNSFWSANKGLVKGLLENEGGSIGFTEDAFEPFYKSLETNASLILPEDIKKTGMTVLFDSLIMSYKGKVRVLTLAPDTGGIKTLLQSADSPQGVRFVSQKYFGEIIRKTVGNDFIKFIAGALLVILLLLIPLFRNLKKVLLSMVPVVTGIIFMFGIMGLFNISFNMFNVISSILIIGLGIDYGIFMVCRCSEDYEHDTDTAVLVSGLTTITGFGALVFAQHPALYSIGLTVLLGIGAAIPSAIYVIPALYGYADRKAGTETPLDGIENG
ncbi:MMPL family transporter [Thermodesulfobacteriota bacterium]